MIKLKYVSACADSSGYGAAARGYIVSLLETEQVDLTCECVSFEQEKTTHGSVGEKIKPYIGKKDVDYKIQVVHLTPENFPRFVQPGIYNIGYCAWETNKLPDQWADYCNTMDEIWVPSDYNIKAFQDSGVIKPIYKILHGIEMPDTTGIPPLSIGSSNSTFVFYYIAQWIERKNPLGLLKAYFTEFQNNEDVNLVLKTYRLNTSQAEQDIIKSSVAAVKKALNMKQYPPVTFFGNLLPREYMKALHLRGDCFVFPVRSEGFGIPAAEAFSYGKPVITTRYGGVLEFANDKNSFLVNCHEVPVYGMIFGNYNGSMIWAEPDIMDLRKQMRYVFEHKEEAKKRAEKGRMFIQERLNWKRIGQDMIDRLKVIEETYLPALKQPLHKRAKKSL